MLRRLNLIPVLALLSGCADSPVQPATEVFEPQLAETSGSEYFLDTGPGPSDPLSPFKPLRATGAISPTYYYLAGRFSVTEPVTLEYAELWLRVRRPGLLHVVVYEDAGGLPGVELAATEQFLVSTEEAGWEPLLVPQIELDAGTHWLAFEPRGDDDFDGAVPFPAANPMDAYASNCSRCGGWGDSSSQPIGVRISGTFGDQGGGGGTSPSSALELVEEMIELVDGLPTLTQVILSSTLEQILDAVQSDDVRKACGLLVRFQSQVEAPWISGDGVELLGLAAAAFQALECRQPIVSGPRG